MMLKNGKMMLKNDKMMIKIFFLDDLDNCWSFTFTRINPRFCLSHNLRRRFIDLPIFKLNQLKYLKINSYIGYTNFRFSDLSRFHQLEVLDMKVHSLKMDDEQLNLPNLRTFSLISHDLISIKIDCPKLEKVRYNKFINLFEFKNYETIKHLEIEIYVDGHVDLFKNLEVLYLTKGHHLNKDILKILPNLNQLHLHTPVDLRNVPTINNLLIIDNVLIQRSQLKRDDLKIFFLDIEIMNETDLDRFNFSKSKLEILIERFSSLFSAHWIMSIDYNHLINIPSVNESIHSNLFFTKFNNIQLIRNRGSIDDQNFFINFVSKCLNLNQIDLEYSDLNAEFYHQLYLIAPSLSILKFKEATDLNIDSNFILKLRLLRKFETNQSFQMKSMLSILKRLYFIERIVFYNKKKIKNMNKFASCINHNQADRVEVHKNKYQTNYWFGFRELKDKGLKVIHSKLNIDELSLVCTRLENRDMT